MKKLQQEKHKKLFRADWLSVHLALSDDLLNYHEVLYKSQLTNFSQEPRCQEKNKLFHSLAPSVKKNLGKWGIP